MKNFNYCFFNVNFFFHLIFFLSFLEKIKIKSITKYIFKLYNTNLSKKLNLKLFILIKILKTFSLIKINCFNDIYITDNLNFTPIVINRFNIQYSFLSLFFNTRVFFKTTWGFSSNIKTLSNLFIGSNWAEREAFDMFGILFSGHSDLRRILNDYGFEGFPNQKNFPVYGFKELIYSDELNSVIYTNLSLTQNYRNFFLPNQWNYIK